MKKKQLVQSNATRMPSDSPKKYKNQQHIELRVERGLHPDGVVVEKNIRPVPAKVSQNLLLVGDG